MVLLRRSYTETLRKHVCFHDLSNAHRQIGLYLGKLDSFQLCSWATIQANSFSLQHVRHRSTWNCYSNTYHSSLGNTISA